MTKPLRDWSRSSAGKSPAERLREVVAEGVRRAAAELEYRDSMGDAIAEDLRRGREAELRRDV